MGFDALKYAMAGTSLPHSSAGPILLKSVLNSSQNYLPRIEARPPGDRRHGLINGYLDHSQSATEENIH
jgi:hypothetical protein